MCIGLDLWDATDRIADRRSNSMKMTATTVRRGLYGMFAAGMFGGIASAAIVMPTANAAPDACTASGIASTVSSVSASTSSYLASHPETNQELTDIAKQPQERGPGGIPGLLRGQSAGGKRPEGHPAAGRATCPLSAALQVTPTPVVEALQAL